MQIEGLIIRGDGQMAPWTDCVSIADRENNRLTPHIAITEICRPDTDGVYRFRIAWEILSVFETLRSRTGNSPLRINSGYRSNARQAELRAYYTNIGQPDRAAAISPHTVGMALDIGADTREQLGNMVQVLRDMRTHSRRLRIGWRQYLEAGDIFVHVDCCPLYYGQGMTWHAQAHPAAWETESEW